MKALNPSYRLPPPSLQLKTAWSLTSLSFFLALNVHAQGRSLSLQTYLDQVRAKNPGLLSAVQAEEAARLKQEEADLVTAPRFFANTQWGKDSRQGLFFQYTSVSNDSYSFGVQQQTSFGMSAKLSYTLNRFEYIGLPEQFLLGNSILGAPFYEAAPSIEISQSLWKNAFGSETRALEKQVRAGTEAQALGETLKQKLNLVEAEATYWRLALARETVKVAEETLTRAKRLADWSAKRAALGLGDRSDALQGQAAIRLRDLQLKSAQDEERAARQAFNTVRGQSGSQVPEALDQLESMSANLPVKPARTFQGSSGEEVPVREDLYAQEELLKTTEAAAEIGRARNTPSLDVVAAASLFSREGNSSTALSNSFSTEQPQIGAGIRFMMPLDFGSWMNARRGYQKEIIAAETELQKKKLELEQEWLDLNHRHQESLERLKVAQSLETTQKEKSDFERDRLSRGRSTTYQVLMFEEDYAQARLNRLRHQFEALSIAIRMKSFQPLAQNQE
jgi:outer membrane protein TolC